jgi:hypothetical protein
VPTPWSALALGIVAIWVAGIDAGLVALLACRGDA